MAYNLQSLITILQGILNPEQTRWIVDENNPQLQSLLKSAESLQQILEKSLLTNISSLEGRIRDVAYKAEDIIETHMVDQMLSSSGSVITTRQPYIMTKYAKLKMSVLHHVKFRSKSNMVDQILSIPESVSLTFSTQDLQQVTQELDSAIEQVAKQAKQELESLKLVEVEGNEMATSGSSSTGAPFSSSKSDLVGVDADLMQLKDRLTNMVSKLEIVPIVGMGGIGKSTLAQYLYDDQLIVSRFDYRGWAVISQDYNMRKILLSLLRCINGKECDQHNLKENDELKDILYKSLYGRRYMIVLDDVWSTKVWDEMRMYFPDNNNGSRIMITTRESDVANSADSKSPQHQVQLLSRSESWNLLHQLVFGKEDCPHVLQEIGQKIARDCGGLPLAINVIGGLLSKMERSKDVWKKIGNDVIAAIAKSDEQFSSILSLSYNHLPNHLKPCFLYMGAFPEDYKIKGSTLVRMWVAEGFVKSNGKGSLEEEAEDSLKALVERNLFMVREYKYGKPKSYSMHDLLRDLCIRKSDEEKFLHVKNGPKVTFSNPRRVSVHTSHGMKYVNASAKSMSLARSFISIGYTSRELSGAFFALRLLRVLDLRDMWFEEFPTKIFEFVNLRFLAVRCYSRIPSEISRLWNLQTLIVEFQAKYSYGFSLPSELWQLSELRNLNVNGLELLKDEDLKYSVLKNVQMISMVYVADLVNRRGFFKSIPNLKKLGIFNDIKTSMVIDLSHLHKLEILRCKSAYFLRCSDCLPKVRFPGNIRKLFLDMCVLNPGVLRTLCALHKLEVLKISRCKFEREEETRYEEWEMAADGDEFLSLQFLILERLSLVRWIADKTNFPRLRELVIMRCYELEEIPCAIGDIPTLQLIELYNCTISAVESARQIEEVQQSDYANYDLKLRIKHDM